MRTIDVAVPEVLFVAATRAMGGVGAGLLASNYIGRETRRTLGWTLLAIGAVTTVPIALSLFLRTRHPLLEED
jgi:hypothetical protein